MATMTKLGGRSNIADAASPSQTDTVLMSVEISMAKPGLAVSMMAVAAGVTTRATLRASVAADPNATHRRPPSITRER
jgi:hypothetical protein